jgi:hypothetical protein
VTNFVNVNGGDAPTTWQGHYDQGMRLLAMAEGHPEVLPILVGAQANMSAALVKYIEAEATAYTPKSEPDWQTQQDLLWQARTAASVQEFMTQHGCTPTEYLAQHPLPVTEAAPIDGAEIGDAVAATQRAVANAEPINQDSGDAE